MYTFAAPKINIMMKKLRLFVLLLVALMAGAQMAHADIVQGRVVDAETKEPLPEASVKYTIKNDWGWMSGSTAADSIGMFTFLITEKAICRCRP